MFRPAGDLYRLKKNAPAVREKGPGQAIEQGGLASAVGSDDGDEVTPIHHEIHFFQGKAGVLVALQLL